MIGKLFKIINSAKKLRAYPIANLAFVVLLDKSLSKKGELSLIWEKSQSNEDDELYYDLLVVSDGLRSACIPAPLLKDPVVWRNRCVREEPKKDHTRKLDISKTDTQVTDELRGLKAEIFAIAPNAQALASTFLESSGGVREKSFNANGDCFLCSYHLPPRDSNYGVIHCTVHPFGYPDRNLCGDFELHLNEKEILHEIQLQRLATYSQ